jgi:hypothetical protein
MQSSPEFFLQEKTISKQNDFIKTSDYLHSITLNLAKNTKEIAFFLIPEKHILEYAGIPTFLQKNHKSI